jgi:hypothetical protein
VCPLLLLLLMFNQLLHTLSISMLQPASIHMYIAWTSRCSHNRLLLSCCDHALQLLKVSSHFLAR